LTRHGRQLDSALFHRRLRLDTGGQVLDLSDEMPDRAIGLAHHRHRQMHQTIFPSRRR